MKPAPILLLNIATVAIALIVYDLVRTDDTPAHGRTTVARTNGMDAAEFDRRLQALEAARRPAMRNTEAAASFSDRLDALEAAMKGNAAPADASTEDTTAIDRGKSDAKATYKKPTEAEVNRFRKLREAVRIQDMVKKNAAHVDRALKKLSINLTPVQRKQVATAFAEFQPRIGVIWREVKTAARETVAAGGEVDREQIVTSTNAVIQTEFAGKLTGIVNHQADAEAIAGALTANGGRGSK